MDSMELTQEQVRNELAQVITNYPTASGRATVESRDGEYGTCVYYTDADHDPVNLSTYYSKDSESNGVSRLVTPICIVGRWIEDFHPEFKNNELIKDILLKNSALVATVHESIPFTPQVRDLLITTQNQQDSDDTQWENIRLDVVEAYEYE